MKTIINFSLVLSLLFMVSCSKEDTGLNNNNETTYVRAKVGGDLKTLASFPIYYNSSNDYVSVYGYRDEVGISLIIIDAIGSYSFEEGNFTGKLILGDPYDFFDQKEDGPTVEYNVISGNVTVTSTDDLLIKGTFYFTGKEYDGQTQIVSEGEFICEKIKN